MRSHLKRVLEQAAKTRKNDMVTSCSDTQPFVCKKIVRHHLSLGFYVYARAKKLGANMQAKTQRGNGKDEKKMFEDRE